MDGDGNDVSGEESDKNGQQVNNEMEDIIMEIAEAEMSTPMENQQLILA